jgi:hypothetical protein
MGIPLTVPRCALSIVTALTYDESDESQNPLIHLSFVVFFCVDESTLPSLTEV